MAYVEVTYPEYSFTTTVSVSPCAYTEGGESGREGEEERLDGSYVRQSLKAQSIVDSKCSCW